MTCNEILSELKDRGYNIPSGTLRRWASEGLVTPPIRYSKASGRGRQSNWNPEVIEQAIRVRENIEKWKANRGPQYF